MPIELLDEIIGYLSYSSRFALSLTCRALHTWIDNPYCTSKKSDKSLAERLSWSRCPAIDIKDLLEIEMWPGYQVIGSPYDLFACGNCMRLRSAEHFTHAMMKGKRGKIGSGTMEQKSHRICLQCCVRLGRISPGTVFRLGRAADHRYGCICARCREFEELPPTVYSLWPKQCSRCRAWLDAQRQQSSIEAGLGHSAWHFDIRLPHSP